MRTAARQVKRGINASTTSLPAPVGGWNARDSLPEMGQADAVTLTNWFPGTTECILRHGHTEHATGLPAFPVETLMTYAGGSTMEMFAVCNGGIYDVTSAGAVGAAVVSGLSNSRWNHCNITTSGGNFLYCANGIDTPYLYSGSAWTAITGVSTPAITGVTTTSLQDPIVFKNRVWFIEKDTLKTWYLPTSAIGGAANAVDMSAVAQLGGYIVAHASWTIDAGTGVDDLYVAVTSRGEVIVYQGTDPSSANTWALKGVWRVGSPVGSRCMYKYAGDLLVITQDGILPMAAALQSSRVNPKVALTDKIQYAVSQAISAYGTEFGWQIVYFPRENQLWLNVPNPAGIQQYAMNSISKSWCNYTGWEAYCWEMFDDDPYFGGTGTVYKAWDGTNDNGVAIDAMGLQAFSHFGNPGMVKRFTMSRPIFRATGTPSVLATINIDFDVADSTAPLSFAGASAAIWDTATWDTSLWSGDLQVLQFWQSAAGVGYYGAPQVKTSSMGIDLRWVSTDIVFERGHIL